MDITNIVEALIGIMTVLIAVFIIPWLKKLSGSQDTENLLQWVKIAVAAAEQTYKSTQGNEKKQYVADFLASKGFTVDSDTVNNAIEAAVLELHNELYGTEKDA